jgi:hypothetical protein
LVIFSSRPSVLVSIVFWVTIIILGYLHRFWLRRDKECCSEEACFWIYRPSIRDWVLHKRGLDGDNSCLKLLFNFFWPPNIKKLP